MLWAVALAMTYVFHHGITVGGVGVGGGVSDCVGVLLGVAVKRVAVGRGVRVEVGVLVAVGVRVGVSVGGIRRVGVKSTSGG